MKIRKLQDTGVVDAYIGSKNTYYGDPEKQILVSKKSNVEKYVKKIAFSKKKKKDKEGYKAIAKHDSVLEHSYLSFAVVGISRLAVEYLEHHRYLSYTETSFRKKRKIKYSEYSGREYPDVKICDEFPFEEFRHELSVALQTNVIVSGNYREFCLVCSHLIKSDLPEARDLGKEFYKPIMEKFGDIIEPIKDWNPYSPIPNRNFFSKIDELPSLAGDRGMETKVFYIIDKLSTVAIAQLRRHRVGSLFVEDIRASRTKKDRMNITYTQGSLSNRYDYPLGSFRRFAWVINGRSLNNFLEQRCSKKAQKEIRDFAFKIAEQVKES